MVNQGHFFYVLLCGDNSLYAGYTNDLKKRFDSHRAKKGAKYTRIEAKHPLKLLYAEKWPTKPSAMRQEYQFKQWPRAKKEAYLYSQGVTISNTQAFVMIHQVEEQDHANSKKL